MLIERVKIAGRQGIGVIVLLSLLMIPALAALAMVATRMRRVRLRNEPRILLGNLSLGGALFWGVVLLCFGGLGILGTFTTERSGEDWGVFLAVMVPIALTGLLLLIYRSAYNHYRHAADRVLEKIGTEGGFSLADPEIEAGGRQLTRQQIRDLLADMRDSLVIGYEERDDGRCVAWFVAPELVAYADALSGKTATRPARSTRSEPTVAWNCPSCGAPNTTPADGKCIYCGTGCPEMGKENA